MLTIRNELSCPFFSDFREFLEETSPDDRLPPDNPWLLTQNILHFDESTTSLKIAHAWLKFFHIKWPELVFEEMDYASTEIGSIVVMRGDFHILLNYQLEQIQFGCIQ